MCGVFSLISLAGCPTTVDNPLSCADGFCSDPAFPFCDVDGTVGGGQRLTCIAVACTPLELEVCRGDDAIVCNSTGDNFNVTECANSCDPAAGGCKPCTPGEPGCNAHIIPKYLPTVCDAPATAPALVISESRMLDTDDDASCTGGVVAQTNGPAICVVHHSAIEIAASGVLSATGKRALALVADDLLAVNGVLDVSARTAKDGPGGGHVLSGGAGADFLGSGGAGFKTPGSAGGSSMMDGGASNGGAAIDPFVLVDLVGGTRGAATFLGQAVSGGAGGAATLISCRGMVSIAGTIDAAGGGSSGGHMPAIGERIAATGGGSGGHVAIQATTIVVTGQLFANGGSGAAAAVNDLVQGARGSDGNRSLEPARGGTNATSVGAGGSGGSGTSAPTAGRAGVGAGFDQGGGGGGSTGFFKTYTPSGVIPALSPSAASPPFEANGTIQTR